MTISTEQLLGIYERQFGPFTHMAAGDKSVWLRFLMQGGTIYAPFIYDLRVGQGLDMGADASPMEKRVAAALTRNRIDALGQLDGRPIIFEVKVRAGLSAVGQLIGYRELFIQQFPDKPTPDLWLVTDRVESDLTTVLTSQNIRLTEVSL